MTDVARASGFVRRERFHAAYAAGIGETPSETRRRGLLGRRSQPPPNEQRVTSIPSPSPSPSTVFVIHTDPRAREALSEALREAGHEVRAFASPTALRASWPSAGAACAVLRLASWSETIRTRAPPCDGAAAGSRWCSRAKMVS